MYYTIWQTCYIDFLLFFQDVNECLEYPCNVNASCTDNEGSFTCQCNDGFTGNGMTCTSKYKYPVQN